MELAGVAVVHSDMRGDGERLHCVKEKQVSLGNVECEDEGERVQKKPRTMQMQVEESR